MRSLAIWLDGCRDWAGDRFFVSRYKLKCCEAKKILNSIINKPENWTYKRIDGFRLSAVYSGLIHTGRDEWIYVPSIIPSGVPPGVSPGMSLIVDYADLYVYFPGESGSLTVASHIKRKIVGLLNKMGKKRLEKEREVKIAEALLIGALA